MQPEIHLKDSHAKVLKTSQFNRPLNVYKARWVAILPSKGFPLQAEKIEVQPHTLWPKGEEAHQQPPI